MSKCLLDTGVVIRHLRGHKPTVHLLRGLGKTERLCVATITRLEIHAGMLPDEKFATQKLLSRFISIDLDRYVADKAGEYVSLGSISGSRIQIPDAIIAATATIHHLTLVTFNTADFVHISGLSLYPIAPDLNP